VTPAPRTILHVDMDAFYASIEQRDNPQLRGKPVVVGGATRGVVAAASYEVRKFGVRSAMPMRDALRRCPQLVRVPPRMSHYRAVSGQIFDVFREFTPEVEGLSLDEAFLDVTASLAIHGDGVDIARAIKRRIRRRTDLTASVGVAPNKLVAKIASDLDKPDGLVVVTDDRRGEVLDPLPVSVIPGIGPRTLARLTQVGVRTVGDLRRAPANAIEPIFGRYTDRMRERAAGIDDRPVVASREEQSISSEETYDTDLAEPARMERELLRLSETTAARLRRAGLRAGTLRIKIRRSDFVTCTRQKSLSPPVDGTDRIFRVGRELLRAWLDDNPGARVRLLGVGGTRLVPAGQQELFAADGDAAAGRVDRTVDEIRGRFGTGSVRRARSLDGS
jgi:DNA polymerase IV